MIMLMLEVRAGLLQVSPHRRERSNLEVVVSAEKSGTTPIKGTDKLGTI
jgi:hypothetical protein